MPTSPSFPTLGLLTVGLCLALASPACRREPAAPAAPATPTVRLYLLSTAAGALDPCGCTKDMLGDVDHLAAFVASEAKGAPHSVVVGAGPMLFLDPKSDAARRTQDLWKAEALAASLGEMRLVAWSPGANDWAQGEGELARLSAVAGADLLAANLRGATAGAKATRVIEVNGHRIGLAGVSEPKTPVGAPEGLEITALRPALESALADLKQKGAEVTVALVTADRGQALRLAEQVHGFSVFVLGKPYDQGEGNDPIIPPAIVDDTLVVQAPNHLQGTVVVDLFVRGPLPFQDATGIATIEKRQSLGDRIGELERRIAQWEERGVTGSDVESRRQDLRKLREELARLKDPAPPREGSYFRYRTVEVRERLGSAGPVEERMREYYRRVNDHNREAFKDRLPPAPRPGEAKYIGIEACANCHEEEHEFWKTTPHANAYATLVRQHKEFNLDCVSCHVTGYEKPGGSSVTHVAGLEAVQCEVCHGPGSRHEDDPDDPTAIVKSPPKTMCAPSCHHPPHVPPEWNAETAWSRILGKGHGMK